MAPKITPAEVTYGETRTVGTIDGNTDLTSTVQVLTIAGYSYALRLSDGKPFRFCGRCDNASGFLSAYGSIYRGICFDCRGCGLDTIRHRGATVTTVETLALVAARRRRADDNARARRERAAAEATAAFTIWARDHRDLLDALAPHYRADWTCGDEPFLTDLANRVRCGHQLTDAQVTAAHSTLTAFAEKEAADAARRATQRYAGTVGERVTVTGVVVFTYLIESDRWARSSRRRVTIEGTGDDHGITATWVSSAAAIWGLDKGDTVTLTGRVTKCEEYRDAPQTTLERCTVTGVVKAETTAAVTA